MKRPCLSVFICFLIGIVFSNEFKINIDLIKLLLLIVMLLGVAIFILWNKRDLCKCLVLLFVFLLGVMKRDIDENQSAFSNFYDKEVSALGIVRETLNDEKDYQKHVVFIEKIKHDNKVYSIYEKLQMSVYEDTDLKIGDKIFLNFKINEPIKNRNPYLFNQKKYLESKGIYALSSTKSYNIKVLSRNNLSSFSKLKLNVVKHIKLSLDKSLNTKNSNTLKSIILGDNSYLDEDYINDFRQLGLSHILAVSGLHIGIIFGFIIYVMSLFKIHKRTSMISSVIIIWIYASLIGFPPSVLRASIMFSFLIIARLLNLRYDGVNILSFAGLLMLIYRTSFVFSVGFQLSFLAAFTILILIPKLQNIIFIKNRKLKSAIVIITAAQIGVLPISFYYFNEFQTLSVISNLIIAPFLSIGIVIGFLIISLSIINANLGIAIGVIGNIVLNISNTIVAIFSNLTHLNIAVASPNSKQIIIYYIAVFILLEKTVVEKMTPKLRKCLYANFLVSIIIGMMVSMFDNSARVQFIDVGQGDSAVVRLKDKNLLIDTGGTVFGKFDVGENILLPYLKKSGIKKLDGVFLSHFDADHVQGLLSLFGEIKIDTIFIGYRNPENLLYREVVKAARVHGVDISVITKGDTLKLNKTSSIEVLHPMDEVSNYEDENDKSLVFILDIFGREILFTGDIEEQSEDYIIENTRVRKVDIMKVPHHGSKTSSKQELIDHFSPKVSVIQLGKNNFGHPNSDVLDRYKKANSHVLRNDLLGLIDVEITRDKMKFSNYITERTSVDNYLRDNLSFIIYVIYGGAIYKKMLKYRQMEDERSLRC